MNASPKAENNNAIIFEDEEEAPVQPVAAPLKTQKSAVPKTVAPKTARKPRQKKEEPLPKKPTTAEEWLEAKVKAPKKFTTNENGDLVIPPYKAGESEVTIVQREKVPATTDHIRRFFAERNESLKEPEAEFAAAKRTLQEVYVAYKRGEVDSNDVLEANQNAAIAQVKVNEKVEFPRNFELLEGLLENDLNFDWYRRNKIAGPVFTIQTTRFPWQAFWTAAPDVIEVDEDEYDFEEENEEARMSGGAKPKKELTAQQRAIIANIKRKRAGGF